MRLSCPAKTFLVGEYLALRGGPTLLLGTEPRFELEVYESPTEHCPFHPESPAGKLWAHNSEITRNWKAKFKNPANVGGLGASSAEFLLLYSALKTQEALAPESWLETDLSDLLQSYEQMTSGGISGGVRPSGADLVAQARGGVTFFEKSQGKIENVAWGFANLGFLLISTGKKVPTHQHLAELGEWNSEALESVARRVIQAFRIQHEENFIYGVRQLREELKTLGFEAPHTSEIIDCLAKAPSVRAAKGCGALGADVVFLAVEKKDIERMIHLLSKKFQILATSAQISEGLYLQSSEMKEVST